MARQFLRNIRLLVGLGESAIDVSELRIAFECVKNQFSNRIPNTLTAVVYNLKESTRQRIIEHGKTVQLEVGYGTGRLRRLFIGQLRHAIPEHEGTEWKTTLYCMDAYLQTLESRVNLTFRSGTPVQKVIEDTADAFGTDGGRALLQDLPPLPNTLGSVTLTGSAREAMDMLGRSYGFTWGFQDGRIEVVGPDPHFADEAIVISKATGMIGSPVVTDLGVTLTTLLNPDLRVNRRILVKSVGAGVKVGQIEVRKFIPTLQAGTYRIGEIIFTGDTHENAWTARIQTYRPPGSIV